MLDLLLPLLILFACGTAFFRVDVYAAFVTGAEKGLRTLFGMLKTLIPLLALLSMLRASGFPSLLEGLLAPVFDACGLPSAALPVLLLRPLSGSASLAAAAELIRECGVFSPAARVALSVLASGETSVYVVGLYFSGRRTGYAPKVLVASLCGYLSAVILTLFLNLYIFSR